MGVAACPAVSVLGGRSGAPPLRARGAGPRPRSPHLARSRRSLAPADPASPGTAQCPPPAPAAPASPAAAAADGIPGSAVPNMAAVAPPLPPGSLPPPRAPGRPRAPPQPGHAPTPARGESRPRPPACSAPRQALPTPSGCACARWASREDVTSPAIRINTGSAAPRVAQGNHDRKRTGQVLDVAEMALVG